MTPFPRNPGLDRVLATTGSSPETLQVYADWLAEREHPLAEWVTDAVRAEAGDARAARRVRERVFEATSGLDDFLTLRWRLGVVAELGVDRWWSRIRLEGRLVEILEQPWCRLLTTARVDLSGDPASDGPIVEALEGLPPTVGRVALNDWRVPAEPDGATWVDLSALRLPSLRDLRLRAHALVELPDAAVRGSVRRLELCVREPGTLFGVDWPALRELHVWTGISRGLVEEIVAGAPGLHTLGLHHPGPLGELLDWPVPASVRELVLAVGSADPASLGDLARRLPDGVRTVRLPWLDGQPLPPRFVTGATDDLPLFV